MYTANEKRYGKNDLSSLREKRFKITGSIFRAMA